MLVKLLKLYRDESFVQQGVVVVSLKLFVVKSGMGGLEGSVV